MARYRDRFLRETERDSPRSLGPLSVLSPSPVFLDTPGPERYFPPPLKLDIFEPVSVSDNRRFDPSGRDRSVRTADTLPVSVGASPKNINRTRFQPHPMSLTAALPCVRRTVRREVIMAKYGGGASHRRKRRTWTSDIGCD